MLIWSIKLNSIHAVPVGIEVEHWLLDVHMNVLKDVSIGYNEHRVLILLWSEHNVLIEALTSINGTPFAQDGEAHPINSNEPEGW